MPSITNSIAKAPNKRPNIFWTTVMTVGPNLDESFAESHIEIVANKTAINIGRYEINPSRTLMYASFEIKRLVAIAPGPAIKGIDNGNIAIDWIVSSSIAVSTVDCLLVCLWSKTIWNAITIKNNPPIILKESILIFIASRIAFPTNQKIDKTIKETIDALI